MTSEKDDIENIFKDTFRDYDVNTSNNEWLSISKKLSVNNFINFNPFNFNIYYVGLLVVTTVVASVLIINTYSNKPLPDTGTVDQIKTESSSGPDIINKIPIDTLTIQKEESPGEKHLPCNMPGAKRTSNQNQIKSIIKIEDQNIVDDNEREIIKKVITIYDTVDVIEIITITDTIKVELKNIKKNRKKR